MAKQPSDNNLNTVYALVISLILVGSLGLAATLLVRRMWFGNSPRIIDAAFRPVQREGEVQGAQDVVEEDSAEETADSKATLNPVTASVQDTQADKIILQIANPTDKPVFLQSAEAFAIYDDRDRPLEFRTNETRTVVLSREVKNIDIYGDFAGAARLELDLPELTTSLPL